VTPTGTPSVSELAALLKQANDRSPGFASMLPVGAQRAAQTTNTLLLSQDRRLRASETFACPHRVQLAQLTSQISQAASVVTSLEWPCRRRPPRQFVVFRLFLHVTSAVRSVGFAEAWRWVVPTHRRAKASTGGSPDRTPVE
jgi:hypothetical protein